MRGFRKAIHLTVFKIVAKELQYLLVSTETLKMPPFAHPLISRKVEVEAAAAAFSPFLWVCVSIGKERRTTTTTIGGGYWDKKKREEGKRRGRCSSTTPTVPQQRIVCESVMCDEGGFCRRAIGSGFGDSHKKWKEGGFVRDFRWSKSFDVP